MTPDRRVFPSAPLLGISQQIQKSSIMFYKIDYLEKHDPLTRVKSIVEQGLLGAGLLLPRETNHQPRPECSYQQSENAGARGHHLGGVAAGVLVPYGCCASDPKRRGLNNPTLLSSTSGGQNSKPHALAWMRSFCRFQENPVFLPLLESACTRRPLAASSKSRARPGHLSLCCHVSCVTLLPPSHRGLCGHVRPSR